MPAASTQENIDFKSVNKQFDWLELNLMPIDSVNHTSPFDTYGRNFATSKIKTIEIKNVGNSYTSTNLAYDFDKYEG